MTANLVLSITAGALVASGVYLLLERSLTRILMGVMLVSSGVDLLFIVASGPAGAPPFVGSSGISDPLPQAMVLTAIVISLGVDAFVLTMAYRSFQLNGHDEVADDIEDARIRQLADADEESDSYEKTDFADMGEDAVSE